MTRHTWRPLLRRWALALAVLVVLLAFAAASRRRTFRLPHFAADEPLTLILAADLDQSGFRSYALRYWEARYYDLTPNGPLALVHLERGEQARTGVIKWYASGGANYDVETVVRPPLIAIVLALSHRALGPERWLTTALSPRAERRARDEGRFVAFRAATHTALAASNDPRVQELVRSQLYATLPPFVFSLAGLAALFFLTQRAARGRLFPAVLAFLFLACAPIEMVCAHYVSSDTLALALGTFGMLLAIEAMCRRGHQGVSLALVAGVAMGLGALGKQTAIVIGIAVVLTDLGWGWRWREDPSGSLRRSLAFGLGAVAVSGPYFLPGNFWTDQQTTQAGFASWVVKRSWLEYPLDLANHSPLLLLGVVSAAWLVRRGWSAKGDPAERSQPTAPPLGPAVCLAVTTLVLVALATLVMKVRVARYFLPAYPALALLSALGVDAVARRVRSKHGRLTALVLVVLPLLGLLLRSYRLGIEAVLTGGRV